MNPRDIAAPQSNALLPAPFQQRVIDSMSAALLRRPSPPCLLRAPTGSGKTFMLARVLGRVSAAEPTLWLWFVPFVTLVQQTEDALLANASGLAPVMLAKGRNQEPEAGTVLLSTAQAVARAKDRKAGYAGDADDSRKTLDEFVALARARGLKVGLVVDEAHIGLDHGTEFGQFAHWLKPEFLVMASATPRDTRLDEFLAKAGKGAREAFTVSRAEVVDARLNKRYIEAVVYDLKHGVSGIADLKRTVIRQAWLQHELLKAQLKSAGVGLTPLLLVQVANGEKAVEDAQRDLMQLCKVPPAAIGTHSADDPDPVMMAAIANDPTKEVLIFKQSAGTGFDAPRAFVLASTKPVNDPDFAMQFIGRVMRVAPPIRAAFPKPTTIPPEFDTAFVFLADADSQQGFQTAVNVTGAVKSQLEGQTEQMVERRTPSGATVFTNRTTPQFLATYDGRPQTEPSSHVGDAASARNAPAWQANLFGQAPESEGSTAVLAWDKAPPEAPAMSATPATEADLVSHIESLGLKAYRRSLGLRSTPVALRRETRPLLTNMGEVSRGAALRLPLEPSVIDQALRAASHSLRAKQVHIELTQQTRHEQDVEIVTDRAALLRDAEAALKRCAPVEEADVRIIIQTIADRLAPHLASTGASTIPGSDEKQLARLCRDAACWVIRKEVQTIEELVAEIVAAQATVDDAEPLPDVLVYPIKRALAPSRKNLYGIVPPHKDNIEADRETLSIDAQTLLLGGTSVFLQGTTRIAGLDGSSAVNDDEKLFIEALDRDEAVIWWHRNPDRKEWAVRIARGEHRNYFYPDFVVCLAYPAGSDLATRLIETKHDQGDASRKARRVPKVYGKVLFVARENQRLRVVNDDGSLGERFDWGDLTPAWKWMAMSAQEGKPA